MAADRQPVILVADDNPATLYSTARILRSASFIVREAACGAEALRLAEETPDAVVLDVNMPDMDGFEVCRILRSRPTTSRTPIIHLSATFVDAGDKVRGLEAGADGYLTHPVEPPVLVATVNAFLRARKAEELMRRSEQKFRAIFNHAINGIALMDEEHTYVEVNPAMCRVLGRERDEIIGRRISDFLPRDFVLSENEIAEQLERIQEWSGVLPHLRPNGSVVELDWSMSIHSLSGTRLAVITDVTERLAEAAERERLLVSERNARGDAERANRIKDEFLAMVSHELRSPLSAIIGWAHILKMHGDADPVDYRTGVLAIERNAQMQEQLIADLLDVSRIASGKLRLDMQKVDVAAIVSEALDGVRESAAARDIAVEREGDAPHLHINGDPVRLHQVMANLLSNAIKFSPRGGKVCVQIQAADGFVEVAVIDAGKGIGSDFLPYVFDTFRQETAGRTRSHEGLGLGLSIVKQLVDMHGGTVAVESPGEGLGSTFRVRFPLAIGDVVTGRAAGPTEESRANLEVLRGLRVLVVDDDDDARLIVRRLLIDYEVEIFEARSVVEALAFLDLYRPQVILSDISMPEQDGYKLIRETRAKGFSPDRLPAIALTALVQPEDRSQVMASGFQAHLAKPVHPGKLISTVAAVAKRRLG